MFSEELYQLDKNTAEFMVDEFGRIMEEQKKNIRFKTYKMLLMGILF